MKKDIYQLTTDELTKRSFTRIEKNGKVFYTRISFIPIGSMPKVLEIYEEKKLFGLIKYKKKIDSKIIYPYYLR